MKIKSVILSVISLPDRLYNFAIMKMKNIETDGKVQIKGKIKLYGTGKIKFGKKVKINSNIRSNPIGGDNYTVLYCAPGANITIGNNTGMSNCSIVCKEKIEIGDNVKIGGGVKIYDTDFHSLVPEERNSGKDVAVTKPVTIKDGAFIGAFSIILKGVTIGENSIVGAGSVVTKTIPDNEIWAGNPAKFIKKV